MIRTVKTAFGLGLLAALTMLALSAMSASATSTGHFVSDSPSAQTTLDITEQTGTTHEVKLHGWGNTVQCHTVKYTRPTQASPLETPTVVGNTVTSISVTGTYSSCTKASDNSAVTVKHNGCHYNFTPGGTGTVHYSCPVGSITEVITNSGTMTFGPQTASGVTYTNITANGKHAITATIAAKNLHGECHGICALLGTTRTDIEMTGAVTIEGTDKAKQGTYVNITAT